MSKRAGPAATGWVVLVSAIIAGGGAAPAQAQSASGGVVGYQRPAPGAYTIDEYVEAHRPRVSPRPLTSEERARARSLMDRLRAAPTVDLADQLKPLADTGDVAAMTAMLNAYRSRVVQRSALDFDAYDINVALAGLWGMALWRKGETTREAARAIDDCRSSSGRDRYWDALRDCGFIYERSPRGNVSVGFGAYANRQSRAPANVVFTEHALTGGRADDEARFQRVISTLRTAGVIRRRDYRWAAGWSEREGEGTWQIYRDAAARFQQARNDRVAAAQAAANASFQAKYDRWKSYAERRQAGQALNEEEREAFHAAATALGGGYLDVYARYYPLPQRWEVEEVCGVGNSVACGRQRELQTHIAAGTRPTFETGGGNVSVRVYDQGGNYRGNTTVPSWALSFISRY